MKKSEEKKAAVLSRRYFLFRERAEKKPFLFWFWNYFFVFASGAGISCLSLLLAFGYYGRTYFWGYFSHLDVFLLNTLPILLLELLLYCLIGRAWIAFLSTAVPVLAASAGNYFKIIFRDDPFICSDVSAIGTALKFTGNYRISVDKRLLFCIVCVVLGTLFLFFFVRGRARFKRRLCAAVLLLACMYPTYILCSDDNIYAASNSDSIDGWSQTSYYISRGFVYPFLHSVKTAFPEKPEGYSDEAALEILNSYTDEDIPEDKKVNVIGIQLEAFNDLTTIGFEGISDEVYADFHQLESESYCGNLVTNIFAGGTVHTERCFLTGDFSLDDFRSDTGSYVRYLKSQGYYTEGSHSCYGWFYNRQNINYYLGFDNYWFYENRYSALSDGLISYDDTLIPDILNLYQESDESVPYFSFSVTYQGHGPYSGNSLTWGDKYWNGAYTDEQTYYILNNYLGSVENTGKNLLWLANQLKDDDAPVVLVIYGDHNPWLGNSNSVYNDLGIDLDTSTETGFYNYYDTRYLIWANDAAKEVLGNDFVGEGPDISPCFLMNLLFQECGWGGGSAYMQYANEVMDSVSVITTNGHFVENGQLCTALSDSDQELIDKFRIIQYYRKRTP